MPLQNRVTPSGEIIADPGRGTLMGNRGILHGPERRLGKARWRHKSWICCRLTFRGRHRLVMAPGTYTELFFLDEAVALAAGHRPCGECRRERFRAFMALWARVCSDFAAPTAKDVDRALHAARIDVASRSQRRTAGRIETMPDGAFVHMRDRPDIALLVWGDALYPYGPAAYGPARQRPGSGVVQVLTPEPIVRILRAGYRPEIHTSAGV